MKAQLKLWYSFLIAAGLALAILPVRAQADGPWWDVTPEPEVPSASYDSILYSKIAPKLRQIEQTTIACGSRSSASRAVAVTCFW